MICDGCGAEIEIAAEVSPKFDAYTDLNYGVCCAASVRLYYNQRDELHTEAAEYFSVGLLKIRDEWKKTHPDGRLP